MVDPIDVADKIFYPIIAIIGVPVNILGIVILSRGKCGLSTCTTCYLVAMATTDLLFIIINPILNYINNYYFPWNFLDLTAVCRIKEFLRSAIRDCSVWFTVTFSFDRFVAICYQKLKTEYCTGKTSLIVLATTSILLSAKNIPWFFTTQPGEIIQNVQWGCKTKTSFWSDPGWVGYNWFDRILTPLLPFGLILLINALTVRHILVTSQVRKGLRAQSKGGNSRDAEMESRMKSIVLLFSISGAFILLWLLNVIKFFYLDLQDSDYITVPDYTFQQVGFMLRNVNCCTNTFIYAVTQSKFREQVRIAVKYPVTTIIRLMKKQN